MAKPEDELLYDILRKASDAYPERLDIDPLNTALGDRLVTGAIDYLVDHHLVDVLAKRQRMDEMGSYSEIRINAKGIDILRDDGGWTARLNVVTVRLEADTLRQLISQRIDAADAPIHEKLRLRERVFALSEQALSDLANQLIRRGIEALPDTIRWLHTQSGIG